MSILRQILYSELLLALTVTAGAVDILWVSTVDGDWNNPSNWWPAQVPGPGDFAHILLAGAFYVDLDGHVTVDRWELGGDFGSQGLRTNGYNLSASISGTVNELGSVLLNGGSIGGNGSLHWYGDLTWEMGSFTGLGSLTFHDGSEVELTTNGTRYLDYRALTNHEPVDWTGGGILYLRYGATVNNQSYWYFRDASTITYHVGAAVEFNNNGGLVRTAGAGAGTTTFGGGTNLTLTQAGGALLQVYEGEIQLDCQADLAGSIDLYGSTELLLNSGAQTLDGTVVDQEGTLRAVNSVVDIENTVFVDHLVQSGGTIQGSGTLIIQDRFDWNNGYQDGSGITRIPASMEMTIGTGAQKVLSARTIDNYGTSSFEGGQFLLRWGASIENREDALFEIGNGLSLSHWYGDYSSFYNAGTFRKLAGTGTSYVQSIPFTNMNRIEGGALDMNYDVSHDWGTVDITAGAVYEFSSGNASTDDGTQFIGEGTAMVTGATLTVSDTLFVDHFEQTGGTVTGGLLLINEDFTWNGGTQSGTGRTVITATAHDRQLRIGIADGRENPLLRGPDIPQPRGRPVRDRRWPLLVSAVWRTRLFHQRRYIQ